DRVRRHVLGHHRTGGDDRAVADGDTGLDPGTETGPYVRADHDVAAPRRVAVLAGALEAEPDAQRVVGDGLDRVLAADQVGAGDGRVVADDQAGVVVPEGTDRGRLAVAAAAEHDRAAAQQASPRGVLGSEPDV